MTSPATSQLETAFPPRHLILGRLHAPNSHWLQGKLASNISLPHTLSSVVVTAALTLQSPGQSLSLGGAPGLTVVCGVFGHAPSIQLHSLPQLRSFPEELLASRLAPDKGKHLQGTRTRVLCPPSHNATCSLGQSPVNSLQRDAEPARMQRLQS